MLEPSGYAMCTRSGTSDALHGVAFSARYRSSDCSAHDNRLGPIRSRCMLVASWSWAARSTFTIPSSCSSKPDNAATPINQEYSITSPTFATVHRHTQEQRSVSNVCYLQCWASTTSVTPHYCYSHQPTSNSSVPYCIHFVDWGGEYTLRRHSET